MYTTEKHAVYVVGTRRGIPILVVIFYSSSSSYCYYYYYYGNIGNNNMLSCNEEVFANKIFSIPGFPKIYLKKKYSPCAIEN